MINLILSILAGAAGWGLSLLIFESVWAGIIPFFIFFIVAMIVLNRITSKKVMPIFKNAQEMAMNLQTLPTMQARINLLDKIVEEFKKAYKYKNYQLFLEQQINSQIGPIYYAQKKFDEAEPYLAKSFIQNWQAQTMYACVLFKKKKFDAMKIQFEKTLKLTRKEPLIWNMYAWCLLENKEKDAALEVLNRGKLNCPSDKITLENVDLIKNKGKIKMKDFKEQWYQFMLEDMPAAQMPRNSQQLDPFQKELLDRYSRMHAK